MAQVCPTLLLLFMLKFGHILRSDVDILAKGLILKVGLLSDRITGSQFYASLPKEMGRRDKGGGGREGGGKKGNSGDGEGEEKGGRKKGRREGGRRTERTKESARLSWSECMDA